MVKHIKKRVLFKIGLLAFKSLIGLSPQYLQDMFQYCHHGHAVKLQVPSYDMQYGRRSFSVAGPRFLNNIPQNIVESDNVNVFKRKLKTFLFNLSDYEVHRLMNA